MMELSPRVEAGRDGRMERRTLGQRVFQLWEALRLWQGLASLSISCVCSAGPALEQTAG